MERRHSPATRPGPGTARSTPRHRDRPWPCDIHRLTTPTDQRWRSRELDLRAGDHRYRLTSDSSVGDRHRWRAGDDLAGGTAVARDSRALAGDWWRLHRVGT